MAGSAEDIKIISTKNDTYQINYKDKLGDGAFAIVYSAMSKKRREAVAVKIVETTKLTAKGKENLRNEVRTLISIDHPNIVKLFDVHDEAGYFYIFTRKMQTDMLEEIVASPQQHLDERTTRFLVMQILHAIAYLHNEDIAHCDIKPENVLLESVLKLSPFPLIQLCDLGYARMMNAASIRQSTKGTALYSARELLLETSHDRSTDIWSVGVIVYVSLSGTFPFLGGDQDDIAADIKRKLKKPHKMYTEDAFFEISKEGLDFMKLILNSNYSNLTVVMLMKNPWFLDEQLLQDLKILEKRYNKDIYTRRIKSN